MNKKTLVIIYLTLGLLGGFVISLISILNAGVWLDEETLIYWLIFSSTIPIVMTILNNDDDNDKKEPK